MLFDLYIDFVKVFGNEKEALDWSTDRLYFNSTKHEKVKEKYFTEDSYWVRKTVKKYVW